ncbi:hypothetical protein EJF18_10317 [Clavispora lusitaniae]|uniref:Uncharacterized protein n=2 Tax=Clavispora lusitaniae TaxID=36911 RepID=C4XWH6_CLAL4|nr:uncharacterized protein CLUG_00299 [Clavispora lusitaniae ATCC 42720]KAF7584228.1 putative integral membrane protein [Clavispora lusitaniae]EEQ36176.1 hypothetical protein CLUG_00299 [Clavispora lusitaniae ATCC 42720]QFZ25226.1 hypothetical protein EJF14_10317 [Clavispora lusitaniae]QFZ31471.1 hypothetical protein EJF16_10317 [Clavispora lusitaniae]QFZ37139.1 hypothetical protein EJF15_10317 [Clavispora lusitaniae]
MWTMVSVYGCPRPNHTRTKTFVMNHFLARTIMPSTAGLIFSTFLGVVTRRVQVQLVGKQYPRSWDRLTGYILSVGVFVGGYAVVDHFVERNRELLNRRLHQLRDQREQAAVFHEFDLEADHRITAPKRSSKFYDLLDKYGSAYK